MQKSIELSPAGSMFLIYATLLQFCQATENLQYPAIPPIEKQTTLVFPDPQLFILRLLNDTLLPNLDAAPGLQCVSLPWDSFYLFLWGEAL